MRERGKGLSPLTLVSVPVTGRRTPRGKGRRPGAQSRGEGESFWAALVSRVGGAARHPRAGGTHTASPPARGGWERASCRKCVREEGLARKGGEGTGAAEAQGGARRPSLHPPHSPAPRSGGVGSHVQRLRRRAPVSRGRRCVRQRWGGAPRNGWTPRPRPRRSGLRGERLRAEDCCSAGGGVRGLTVPQRRRQRGELLGHVHQWRGKSRDGSDAQGRTVTLKRWDEARRQHGTGMEE